MIVKSQYRIDYFKPKALNVFKNRECIRADETPAKHAQRVFETDSILRDKEPETGFVLLR